MGGLKLVKAYTSILVKNRFNMATRNNRWAVVGVGGKQVNADWNSTDPNSPATILNKPDLSAQLHYEVVNTLPTEDIDTHCIYLVPSTDPQQSDVYDEWMYINNAWEKIGSTGIAQVNSDWNATSGVAEILNKPNLATVATSGDYTDLSNTPSLAAVATTGDYDDLTNKPTIPTVNDATITIQQNGSTVGTFTTNDATDQTINLTGGSNDWFGTQEEFDALQSYDEDTNYHIQQELATVAFTGDYDDLTNKPAIPTQVQADWTESDPTSPSYIAYKPPLPQTTTLETSATPVLDVEDSVIITCTTPVTSLTINRVGGGQYESNVYFTTGNTPFTMTVPNSLDGIVGSTSLQANTDYIVCIKDNRMVISYNGYTGGVTVNNNAPTLAYGQTSTVGTVDGTNLTVTMPAAPSFSQVNSDWNASSGVAEILNKPNLATVATSGDYSDLQNAPIVPTQTSDLLNDGDGQGNTYVLNTDLQSGGTYAIPTQTSDLANNGDGQGNIYITTSDINNYVPTTTSQLQNDGDGGGNYYVTNNLLPTQTSQLTNDGDGQGNTYVLDTDLQIGGTYAIPTQTSQLFNDGDGQGNNYVLSTELQNGGTYDISTVVKGEDLYGTPTALTLRQISQADYDALVQGGTVDPNTVYMIS